MDLFCCYKICKLFFETVFWKSPSQANFSIVILQIIFLNNFYANYCFGSCFCKYCKLLFCVGVDKGQGARDDQSAVVSIDVMQSENGLHDLNYQLNEII